MAMQVRVCAFIMDPCDILNVRFHFGGQFVRMGPNLDYVGGDEAMSEIERDKLSLPELKGYLGDHVPLKKSMKIYFLLPGKELVDGLFFLCDDAGCIKMCEYITEGGVADVYVEYSGEQDDGSASDFENEMGNESAGESDVEPDAIITAEEDVQIVSENPSSVTGIGNLFVANGSGAITQVQGQTSQFDVLDEPITGSSQIFNPGSQSGSAAAQQLIVQQLDHAHEHEEDANGSAFSDSEEDDSDYVAGNDDSGLDDEYVELREEARAFKKRIRDSKRWAERNPSNVVPIDLVANVEEVIGEDHFDSDDEDYSYDDETDDDGQVVRRKSQYIRYNPKADIPILCLGMVFRSKSQMKKALIKYGLLTFRSIIFMKSEDERIRAKCG